MVTNQDKQQMFWHRRIVDFCYAVAVSAIVMVAALPVSAAVDEGQAAKQVADSFGVQVLKVRAGDIDGTPVWFITVMNKGGDADGAFQVNMLAMDQATGELVSNFRHGASGPGQPATKETTTKMIARPDVLRSRSWR